MPFTMPDRPGASVDELKSDLKNNLYPHIRRKVITAVVGTSQTDIAHGLPEIPSYVGWFPRADARVWRSKDPDTKRIYLTASASVTCDIEVSCA